MAMKLHRLGLNAENYLRALVRVERKTCRFPNLDIFEARIRSDEMMIRTQHWLYWPAERVGRH